MKQSQKTSMMGSTLIRLMLVLLLALSLFAFAACQKNDQGENENEEPNGNVETPDDPSGHEHVFGGWVTTQNPSCTVAGTKERVCTVEGCGKKETASIDPLGHDVVNHAAKAATCTAIGWDAYETCSRCDYTTYEEIPALGHDLIHHDAQAATCTAVGWNAYETCSRCDYTTYEEIPALGHDIVHHDAQAVSCTAIGWNAYETCSRCDYTTYEEIPALGHNYNENNVCTRCGQLDPTYYTEGMSFTLLQDDTYSVTGYSGSATDVTIPSVYQNKAVTTIGVKAFFYLNDLTSVFIPDSVTSIQNNAFTGCSGLNSITIPDNVTAIGGAAFNACSGLTSIYIPADVTQIGIVAFSGCSGLTSISVAENNPVYHSTGNCLIHTARGTLIAGCNNSVIPDDGSVTMIADVAFLSCSGLTSITIPDSVTAIGRAAFDDCSNLTYVYYGGSASDWDEISIGYNNDCLTGATRYYYSETKPTVDGDWWHYVDGVPTVWHRHSWGDWTTTTQPSCISAGEKTRTCTECNETETAEVPALGHDLIHHDAQAATCTAVGWNAYETCSRCDYTTYEEIPALGHDIVHHDAQAVSCTAIGWNAYDTCSRCDYTTYEEIPALGHNYNENNVCTRCGQLDPTYYTDGLVFSSLGDTYSVTGYNGNATDVVIPVTYQNKAVTTIGCEAFRLKGIVSILIPEGVTTIESSALSYCRSLISLNIPKSVTSIGDYVFQGCSGLTSISVAENNPVYHSIDNCLIETESKTLVAGCCNSIIPTDGSVTAIGDGAFYSCRNLTSISIPVCVTLIGTQAFAYCTGLTSIVIPEGGERIEYEAFRASGLTSISIPEGVTKIRCGAFYLCSELEFVVFPKSLTSIEDRVFSGPALNKVYYAGGASDWDKISIDGFNEYLINATIYFYSETKQTEGDWWHYVDGVPTTWQPYYTKGLSFTLLENDTYSVTGYSGSATNVIIPVSYREKAVTEIGVKAFFYLNDLTSVFIPDSVTSIQNNAFTGCSGLTSLSIPAGVTQIGMAVFAGCSGLTSISVAENNPTYHSAGNCLIHTATGTLIAGCNNSVIPDDGSVTMIADVAFSGCSNLSSIVIPDSVETIGWGAFDGCNNLTYVYYGGSASDWDGIWIGDNNDCLTGATRYYYSETEPTSAGNWWHYVNGVPTVWTNN